MVTVATVCFSDVFWGRQEGQQQFATQTLRVHLLGIDSGTPEEIPKNSHSLLEFSDKNKTHCVSGASCACHRAKRSSHLRAPPPYESARLEAHGPLERGNPFEVLKKP